MTEGPDTVTFTHDAGGNRISDGEFNYTWDAFDRLRTVTNTSTGDLVASYAYDALDRRVVKTVAANGETTRYVYDGAVVVEERDGAGVLLRQFVHGQRIDEVLVMDRNLDGDSSATGAADERLHYVHDALGTVVALANDTGHVVEGYLYDAYGSMAVVGPGANGSVEWGDDDTVAAASAFDNPYAFTGQRLDVETGFYYYRARYYDAEAGRFMSRDLVGIWFDVPNLGNGFAYVGNKPLASRDPTGLWQWSCTGQFHWIGGGSFTFGLYDKGLILGAGAGGGLDIGGGCQSGAGQPDTIRYELGGDVIVGTNVASGNVYCAGGPGDPVECGTEVSSAKADLECGASLDTSLQGDAYCAEYRGTQVGLGASWHASAQWAIPSSSFWGAPVTVAGPAHYSTVNSAAALPVRVDLANELTMLNPITTTATVFTHNAIVVDPVRTGSAQAASPQESPVALSAEPRRAEESVDVLNPRWIYPGPVFYGR